MQARKIVDSDVISALDEILPKEITDIVLIYFLNHSKKVSSLMGAIEKIWWEEDPVDFNGEPYFDYDECYRTYIEYSCQVDKEVDRCKVCMTVQKIRWYYYNLDGSMVNPWEELCEYRDLPFHDCKALGHINVGLMGGYNTNVMIAPDYVRITSLENGEHKRRSLS